MNLNIPHTITSYKYKKKVNTLNIFVEGTELYNGDLVPRWNLQYGKYPSPIISITSVCLKDLLVKINKLIETDYFHDCDLDFYYKKGNT